MSAPNEAGARREKTRHRIRSIESAAIAGVVYAVLAIVAMAVLSRFPDLELSDEQVTAWFNEADHQAALILGLNLAAVSSVAFLWFVAVIRRRIGDREDRFFSTVFFGSAILYVAIWLVGVALLAAPVVALTIREAGSVSQDTATLALGSAAALILVAGPRVQAVFVFSTSTLILRTGALPKWLAFLGYLTGAGMFAMPIVHETLGIGLPAWVLIVSITILVSRSTNSTSGVL